MSSTTSTRSTNQRGAVILYVGFLLVVFLGFAALAVDVGYLRVARNQLQNAADASALAAARKLGSIYQPMSYEMQQSYVCDPATILPVAQSTAASNWAATQSVVVPDADVVIGTWDPDTKQVTPTFSQPDAVEVTTRRDSTAGGPVGTFFGHILGFPSVPVGANAVAALTGQSTAKPGDLQLPIGVSRTRFPGTGGTWCGQVVKFSPTTDPDACAGWTTFDNEPASNSRVRDILEGTLTNHVVQTGVTDFQFINGDLSEPVFEELMRQYQARGHDVDAIYNPANGAEPGTVDVPSAQQVPLCMDSNERIVRCGTSGTLLSGQLRYPPCSGNGQCSGDLRYAHEWATTIVVYDSDTCTPGGQPEPVAGFAEVVVFNVGSPSNKLVEARIRCGYVDAQPTRSGGGNYGKKGSIPGLVR